ncbi:hypothetical protein [Acinetobacter bouvetii]|uniref:Uncharacterized protein n=1 Tax=Acinetobacter bouvetii TaxID=202951 RepID=A0A811GK47_9GAMM|nr:hypothetical protein [Acinetobacter bouvetii]CAB1217965.1 hypothetical protein SFB21_2179 [Acinetobacter bouvetii]
MISGKDALSYKDNRGFTDRDINWLWNFQQLHIQYPQVGYSSVSEKRKIIFNIFDNSINGEEIYKSSLINKDKFLINKNDLNWAKDPQNSQLLIFTINMLLKFNNILFVNLFFANNYDYFIDFIDKLNTTKEIKINQINDIKTMWSNLQYKKEHTKWIDSKNKDQINWAWDYLKKSYKLAAFPILPINDIQRYDCIISSIDLIGYLTSEEAKELFLIKMKKTWSQKKFRDSGKIKKPHHLPLTKERHEQLKNLAEYFNKSIPDVLDFIIEKVYTECMTDTDGKPKKYQVQFLKMK